MWVHVASGSGSNELAAHQPQFDQQLVHRVHVARFAQRGGREGASSCCSSRRSSAVVKRPVERGQADPLAPVLLAIRSSMKGKLEALVELPQVGLDFARPSR